MGWEGFSAGKQFRRGGAAVKRDKDNWPTSHACRFSLRRETEVNGGNAERNMTRTKPCEVLIDMDEPERRTWLQAWHTSEEVREWFGAIAIKILGQKGDDDTRWRNSFGGGLLTGPFLRTALQQTNETENLAKEQLDWINIATSRCQYL
jgi:hypothetical protein